MNKNKVWLITGAGLVLTPLLLSASAEQPENNYNQGNNKLNEKE